MPSEVIDYRCDDGSFLASTSCGEITNPVMLSTSDEVNDSCLTEAQDTTYLIEFSFRMPLVSVPQRREELRYYRLA
jgi:hypothetical protein